MPRTTRNSGSAFEQREPGKNPALKFCFTQLHKTYPDCLFIECRQSLDLMA